MDEYDEKARLAEGILSNRRQRHISLPSGIFGEPAWEMLLALFLADARGERITGADIETGIPLPAGIVSRWLKYLSTQRLVVGYVDGNLSDDITLSSEALDAVERYLEMTKQIALSLIRAGDFSIVPRLKGVAKEGGG